MSSKVFSKGFLIKSVFCVIVYFSLTALFNWVVADDWSMTKVTTTSVNPSAVIAVEGKVAQQFVSTMENLECITIMPHLSDDAYDSDIRIAIQDGENTLWELMLDATSLISNEMNPIVLDGMVKDVKNRSLTLIVETQEPGMYLWTGNSINTGRFDIQVQAQGLMVNEKAVNGCLVLSIDGHDQLAAYKYIWPASIVLFCFLLAFQVISHAQFKKGKVNAIIKLFRLCGQYRYLLNQLVRRDFIVKYKSSSLGILWSFLNPLITMFVYLIVFSTLFRSDIENFPVYLMSGIILFNTFSEATNLGLNAIVSNSALITKVYMPKIIYPFSKVLSSIINLCISLIPLLIVMLATGLPMQKSLFLLPLAVLFLLMFSFGMSLLLATLNVFFRDTQFLWSVMLMIWNFLSPVFYPESIIAAELLPLYHFNPMYQILHFMRSIVLNGVSPAPITFLYCLLASLIPLGIGLWIFRKKQDEFILHL